MGGSGRLLTPLIITHFSPKSSYGDLAPPSCGIVEKTITSMDENLCRLSNDIISNPILVYNYPPNGNKKGPKTYMRNLRKLSNQFEIKFLTLPNEGLRTAILHGLKPIDTPYVVFIEHDWKFIRNIRTNELLYELENNKNINSVRFNKWKNKTNEVDSIVEEDKSTTIPLCRVSSYTNFPHISRVRTYKKWVEDSKPTASHIHRVWKLGGAKFCGSYLYYVFKEKYFHNTTQVPLFDGVEGVIDTKYKYKIHRFGFDKAHSKMGVYLYGKKGDGPFVQHLGWQQPSGKNRRA